MGFAGLSGLGGMLVTSPARTSTAVLIPLVCCVRARRCTLVAVLLATSAPIPFWTMWHGIRFRQPDLTQPEGDGPDAIPGLTRVGRLSRLRVSVAIGRPSPGRYCCHQENPLQRSKTASHGARTSSRPLRVQRVLLIVPATFPGWSDGLLSRLAPYLATWRRRSTRYVGTGLHFAFTGPGFQGQPPHPLSKLMAPTCSTTYWFKNDQRLHRFLSPSREAAGEELPAAAQTSQKRPQLEPVNRLS
ncbi:hypothetical protein DFP87_1353 [Achromobacter marplatensis]|uniref:Uncharacterized protein n=1 Tax=Achromobacter marplatensis TaxID=470868 RepID=A0ABX9FW32_9BURK|nr:hypothetical protein DFP87_1353 [Achromobacter marplatensis]CAB3717308.1 hypothetical protein LMG26219_06320 [Achromobacter marplatensis]